MQTSELQQLIDVFSSAFERLDVTIPGSEIEHLAVTIHEAMTVQARSYHHLDHALNLLDVEDPVQCLSALYHDVVYYQVDLGFSPDIRATITPFVVEKNGDIHIVKTPPQDERYFSMILDVFDLQPGDVLPPSCGLNEFLSALVVVRKLSGILSSKDLLRVAVCIEASIPFRGMNENGKNHFDVLESRLYKICEKGEYELAGLDVIETVRSALIFANKDVASFSEPDVGDFLDATWKLLPELNVPLRAHDIYSIRSYREALMKMNRFQNEINPDHIFHTYRGEPSNERYQEMVSTARNNIRTASDYICTKLLAVGILEALAEASGGDAPFSLFMGDLPRPGESQQRLEDFLPPEQDNPAMNRDSKVYQLLISGRSGGADFDVMDSPLALFVYQSLSPEEIKLSIQEAIEYFEGGISARGFLSRLDEEVLHAIARASAQMVPTRRSKLMEFTY